MWFRRKLNDDKRKFLQKKRKKKRNEEFVSPVKACFNINKDPSGIRDVVQCGLHTTERIHLGILRRGHI